MNEHTVLPAPAVTLSREELLAVLHVLRASTIPGLDREPSGDLTPEQEAFALVVARRALLARDLAQVRADSEFLVQRRLLDAVGACAYAHDSILVYTWPPGARDPQNLFGHTRGGDVVAHTRPDAVLHRFTLLPSRAELVAQVLAFCKFDPAPTDEVFDFTVQREDFAAAREAAVGGSNAAAALLVRGGAPEDAAGDLAADWVASPRVSALQTLTRQADGTADSREFSLVQAGPRAWWVAPMPGEKANAPIQVKTASASDIRDLLTGS